MTTNTSAEPRTVSASGRPWSILSVAVQLALLIWVFTHFRLESPTTSKLLMLAGGGFLIHALLPRKLRLGFFVALSIAALGLVLPFKHVVVVVATISSLIALCHLPIPWGWRYVGLTCAIGALAWARSAELVSLHVFWRVLGSLFIFRLIVYLYDLRYSKLKPSLGWSLSYFFLLPNVCFPLFPVVDYKTFRKTYYNEEAGIIYQRGVDWIFRGVVQLILYRLVYRHLAVDPIDVMTARDMVLYIVSSFLFYLRVSGQFHLIVGILLLFGFNLPPTQNKYFLASSLVDFWRRINIYWKDFMMKVFFYPVYDRLRRRDPRLALGVATATVFLATWLLHSYQWYWITGTFLFSKLDTLYWLVLGSLMVVGTLQESRLAARRRKKRSPTVADRVAHGLRICATFTVLATLWSMWTSDSLEQWLGLWRISGVLAPSLIVLVLALHGAATLLERWSASRPKGKAKVTPARAPTPGRNPWRSAVLTTAALAALLVASQPDLYWRLGAGPAEFVESLRAAELNRRDARARTQGYYEQLIAANQSESHWQPSDWQRLYETEAWNWRQDMMLGELEPNVDFIFNRQPFSTNRWGMRDRDYSHKKPAGAVRLALLGSSHVLGWGVADGETFETHYEDMLNAERLSTSGEFEVLNFAVAGYSVAQDLIQLEQTVLGFKPDIVLETDHSWDASQVIRYLARVLDEEHPITIPELAEFVAAAGASSEVSQEVNIRRLWKYRWQMLEKLYGNIVARCREAGAVPVWVYMPDLMPGDESEIDRMVELAQKAGFVVLDLRDAFDGHLHRDLQVADWDDHANAFAHHLFADKLYLALGPGELRRLINEGRYAEKRP